MLTAKRWHALIDNPIANGAEPFTLIWLCSSAAAPNTTMTRTNVIRNSIATPCPSLTPGPKLVLPSPTDPCMPSGAAFWSHIRNSDED